MKIKAAAVLSFAIIALPAYGQLNLPTPPNPFRGPSAPGPVPGGLCNLPQAALDNIKKAIPTPPSPTEIAKAITIPIDDIAKKAVELQKAPLDAVGSAIKKEVDEKAEEIKAWAWEKVRPILYATALLTALFVALIISVPILWVQAVRNRRA